ncbi:MAG: hypothetical protein ACYCQJ_16350 [Nitrososphaerales archaeon]
MNGWIGWVGESRPAGSNPDITQIRNSDFTDVLTVHDRVIADHGYRGADFNIILPISKPRQVRGTVPRQLDAHQVSFYFHNK